MLMTIPFGTHSYRLKALKASAQRCLNFYAENQPKDAKSPVVMYGSPGLLTVANVGTGPIRGLHVMNGVLYVVSGNSLYSVTNAYAVTQLGNGILSENVVNMADNGTQVCIVNSGQGYIWNASTKVFQQITDANFYPANTVTYFDGYFLFDKIGTNQFFYSQINDGTTFNGLDFDSATVDSSFVVGLLNQQQNLLIFKQNLIETWYDSGNNDSPFMRYNGATIERGCAAPLSIVKEDNAVFFLGNDRIAYRLDFPLPRRISTPAIEQEWATYQTVADCQVFNATFEGHKFLFWNFPTANKTWCYDIETTMFHERESFDVRSVGLGRWRGNVAAFFNNQTVIGDSIGNELGVMSSAIYQEYGNPIIGQIISQPIHKDRRRVFFNSIELDCEVGQGLTTGQGSDPQMMMDWSNDGGATWSQQQLWKSMGKIGEYRTRLRWTRLGQARERIFRVTVSDPVPRAIIAAVADLEASEI